MLLLIAAGLLMAGCGAQQAANFVAQGDRHMSAGDYQNAVEQYQRAAQTHPTDTGRERLAAGEVRLGKYAAWRLRHWQISQRSLARGRTTWLLGATLASTIFPTPLRGWTGCYKPIPATVWLKPCRVE